jgi:hypothetical protein
MTPCYIKLERLKLKGNAGSSRSRSKPDAETSHAPLLKTIVELYYDHYTFIQGKKSGVSLGSSG